MNTCHDIIFLFLFFYLHTFSLQESQEDGRCHATTFAAISFYVFFYFYFVLYYHCCKNKLSYLILSLAFLSLCGVSRILVILIYPVFGVFIYLKSLMFCFLIKFTSVPDVTPNSSAMDLFVPCSVHDTRHIFL